MLNDSFTVNYSCVSRFVVLVIHLAGVKSPVLVNFPSMMYSRRDGLVTIRANKPGKTVSLDLRGATVIGITKDGKSEYLSAHPISTYAGQVDWVRNRAKEVDLNVNFVKTVVELRKAVAEAGESLGLVDAVDAANVVCHEKGLALRSARPLRLP